MNKPNQQILDTLLETRHGDMAHIYKSRFKGALLEDAEFSDCLFDCCDFSGTHLNGVRMHNCRFTKSSYNTAHLMNSQLSACTISESEFSNANLKNANLWGSTNKRLLG